MSFLSELRRRKVFRVAATYAVASWLIIQVVSAVASPLNLPEWFETVVVVSLAIGFPIAILFAWAFEMTPDGIRATTASDGTTNHSEGRTLDYALLGALIVVAGVTISGQLNLPTVEIDPVAEEVPLEKSIAVLPFVDMSPDGDQEYFGDGIAEELLNELTSLDGLRVAGRTSSFSFKNSDDDLRTIGEALNVSLILEGSVRKDGDRLRITAQLINVADGYHHWSETYDRDLVDIFAIQDEIAEAVAGVLGVRLGVGNVNSFRGAGTENVKAYEVYLQATKNASGLDERIRLLERAVELDPDYAAALAALGISFATTMWSNPPEEAPAILDRAIPVLLRAIERGPDSAYAYQLLATVNYARMDWVQSEQYYEKSSAIARDGGALSNHGNMLMRSGRSEAALQKYDAAAAAEDHPVAKNSLQMNAFLSMEDFTEARNIAAEYPDSAAYRLNYLIALNEGEPTALQTALRSSPHPFSFPAALSAELSSIFESPEEVLLVLKSVFADEDSVWPSKYHDIALLAAYFGDYEFSLEVFSFEARLTTIRFGALWYPVMSGVRQLPGFKDLVTELNLVEYWRAYGWSSHCQPLGTEDFECY